MPFLSPGEIVPPPMLVIPYRAFHTAKVHYSGPLAKPSRIYIECGNFVNQPPNQ